MPTAKYFDKCPPFPRDTPVADLPTLSLSKLQANEADESQRLFAACREHGFFLLDLQSSDDGLQLQQDGEGMFDIAADLFDLTPDVFERYACDAPRSLIGYKRPGNMRVEGGKVDATAVYTISQDDILGNIKRIDNPQSIEERRTVCRDFIEHAFDVATTIFNHLDSHLDLPRGTLASRSRLNQPSATSIRLLRTNLDVENRQITLGGHTDIGTLTILLHVAGGLQILPSGKDADIFENWRYVKPSPGYALVNMGDTLVQWTGGVLKSAVHRVITAPGEQAKFQRQSLAYLIRADDSQSMERIKVGRIIPPLAPGEEDEKLPISQWASQRAATVMRGEIKVQTTGGIPLAVQ